MKFVITGGAGFIGSHIAKHLVEKNHDVIVVDNLSRGRLENLSKIKEEIVFKKMDILDFDSLKEVIFNSDGIFHQAALTSVPESFTQKEKYHNVNVKGTENIFKLAKEFSKKVVYASSSSIYGNTTTIPIQENFEKNQKQYISRCDFIIQSYDTAFLKKESADFSAITTWGVFKDDDGRANIILLNAFKDRYEFPELRKVAHEEYLYWRPDMVIVESKASGIPLTHELRDMGIPVINFTPSRGNDKHARVNSVAPLFEMGMIYAPMHEHYAQEVVEECASFPFGDHDDYVDSTTQAIMRIKQGGLVRNKDAYEDEPLPDRSRLEYYG